MAGFNKCIVSWIDLIGISQMIYFEKPDAVSKMNALKQLVGNSMNYGRLESHAHAYTFNDSALLLAFLPQGNDNIIYNIMKELNLLKQSIDTDICESYGISIKGTTFADDPTFLAFDDQITNGPRHVHIKASSIAFANVSLVEKALKAKRMGWYIDERIVKEANLKVGDDISAVELMPDGIARQIHMYQNNFM